MIARRRLLVAAILVLSDPALAAQSGNSMLSYVGTSPFWLDVPTGWIADRQAAQKLGVVFVLMPLGTNFNNAPVVFIGNSYKDMTVAAAVSQTKSRTLSRDPAAQLADLPSIEAGSAKISLLEIRSKASRSQPFEAVAFVALGQDVLVLSVSGLVEESYNLGRGIFAGFLKSYKEAGIEVQKAP